MDWKNSTDNAKANFRKKYKRKFVDYQKIAGLLDKCCLEISGSKNAGFLKNPFKGFRGEEQTREVYQSLGTGDKIAGILQCYEFFQPLSKFLS